MEIKELERLVLAQTPFARLEQHGDKYVFLYNGAFVGEIDKDFVANSHTLNQHKLITELVRRVYKKLV